jgi:hypothetical protein
MSVGKYPSVRNKKNQAELVLAQIGLFQQARPIFGMPDRKKGHHRFSASPVDPHHQGHSIRQEPDDYKNAPREKSLFGLKLPLETRPSVLG